MKEKKFKVGDKIYVSHFGRREIKVNCPVCFGKRVVRLILGDDSIVEMPCECCGRGYEPAKGYVVDWRMDAGAKKRTITQVETKQTQEGELVEYRSDHYIHQPQDIFTTEKEALADSKRKADKYNLEHETKAEFIKGKPDKNYSWNAGYHRRLVKKAEKEIEYHSKMAKICKERAKP